jgi:hypothetical protein
MTGREFSYWLFEEQNWIWIVAAPFLSILVSLFIYIELYIEPTMDGPLRTELKSEVRQRELAISLKRELDDLALPPETEITGTENLSKPNETIFLTTKYRTSTERSEFLKAIDQELAAKHWIRYKVEHEGAFTTYRYCRGKYEALLSRQYKIELWSSSSDDWRISFILEPRYARETNQLPEDCRK